MATEHELDDLRPMDQLEELRTSCDKRRRLAACMLDSDRLPLAACQWVTRGVSSALPLPAGFTTRTFQVDGGAFAQQSVGHEADSDYRHGDVVSVFIGVS